MDLAVKLGFESATAISLIESGQRNLAIEQLIELPSILGQSTEYFIGKSEKQLPEQKTLRDEFQNKILSLGEIDTIQGWVNGMLDPNSTEKHYQTFLELFESTGDLHKLFATARAYHELNDKYEQGLEKAHLEGHAMARANPEDKPHAPTIKAFIDGLKWANDPKKRFTVNGLVNHLESILKDL